MLTANRIADELRSFADKLDDEWCQPSWTRRGELLSEMLFLLQSLVWHAELMECREIEIDMPGGGIVYHPRGWRTEQRKKAREARKAKAKREKKPEGVVTRKTTTTATYITVREI